MEVCFGVLDETESTGLGEQGHHDRQHVRQPETDVRGAVPPRRDVARPVEGEAREDRVGGKDGLELQVRARADVLQPVIDGAAQPARRTVLAARIVCRQGVVLVLVEADSG